jgi:hypothetical protein
VVAAIAIRTSFGILLLYSVNAQQSMFSIVSQELAVVPLIHPLLLTVFALIVVLFLTIMVQMLVIMPATA